MLAIIGLIQSIIQLYIYCFIAQAILSWLVVFNVVNPHSQFVNMFGTFLERVTAPVLNPIRRFVPDLGGIDISPVLAILGLVFLSNFIGEMALNMLH